MKNNLIEKIITQLTMIGSAKSDSEEIKLQKSLLVVSSIPFMLVGVAWGIMYFLFGETLAGIIPLSYSIISLISIIYFALTRRFRVFRISQLFLILLLPCALMIVLGGFVSGSAVILWALICPLGAMLFDKQSNSPHWLLAFIFLVSISFILQPLLNFKNNLTTGQINLFFVINLIAVGSLIFLMIYYFVREKNFFQARSEALLLNILPKEIAEELKANGSAEAKQFENVTIMFTDFKDFTQITEKLKPTELIAEINTLFKAFDSIISKHNIEKIKTIGDSYMCAGGLPVANKTHAVNVVSATMDIQQFMQQHSKKRMMEGKESFEIRIGVHTGPVVAGVVGDKKFSYDIWGDSVNIASRMESSGEAGKINISESTYELVKDRFTCVYRGKIEAKHKGMIDMYFVEGIS